MQAQTRREQMHQRLGEMDSVLSSRYNRHRNLDTCYIHRPDAKWTVKVRFNVSGSVLRGIGMVDGVRNEARVHADYKGTMSVGVTYMGISLGAAINPGALTGRYKDYEFNANSYGNRMGVDISYQRAKNFTGWHKTSDGGHINLPKDLVALNALNVNAYYAFNHRHFSFPAAFMQSYIQRRSAGSWMLAVSYQGQSLKIRQDATLGSSSMKLLIGNLGIGGGYGYNYVLPHKWLLHLSLTPTLIVLSRDKRWVDDERQKTPYSFPEVIVTGRGAVVRTFGRYFLGSNVVFSTTKIGDRDQLEILNTKWRVRTFFGMRF